MKHLNIQEVERVELSRENNYFIYRAYFWHGEEEDAIYVTTKREAIKRICKEYDIPASMIEDNTQPLEISIKREERGSWGACWSITLWVNDVYTVNEDYFGYSKREALSKFIHEFNIPRGSYRVAHWGA